MNTLFCSLCCRQGSSMMYLWQSKKELLCMWVWHANFLRIILYLTSLIRKMLLLSKENETYIIHYINPFGTSCLSYLENKIRMKNDFYEYWDFWSNFHKRRQVTDIYFSMVSLTAAAISKRYRSFPLSDSNVIPTGKFCGVFANGRVMLGRPAKAAGNVFCE